MPISILRQSLDSTILPDGWTRCHAAEEVALAAQLQREVLPGHNLFDQPCIALARRGACDGVLFFVEGSEQPLAMVHLTWRVPRDDHGFPWAERFASVAQWAASISLPAGVGRSGSDRRPG